MYMCPRVEREGEKGLIQVWSEPLTCQIPYYYVYLPDCVCVCVFPSVGNRCLMSKPTALAPLKPYNYVFVPAVHTHTFFTLLNPCSIPTQSVLDYHCLPPPAGYP